MPIVIQRTNQPSGTDMFGQGITNAVQTWLQGGRDLANQQTQGANALARMAMMGSSMRKSDLAEAKDARKEASREAILQAIGGMDLNSKDALGQLMKIAPQAPELVTPIISNLRQQHDFAANEALRRQSMGLQAAANSRAAELHGLTMQQKRQEAESYNALLGMLRGQGMQQPAAQPQPTIPVAQPQGQQLETQTQPSGQQQPIAPQTFPAQPSSQPNVPLEAVLLPGKAGAAARAYLDTQQKQESLGIKQQEQQKKVEDKERGLEKASDNTITQSQHALDAANKTLTLLDEAPWARLATGTIAGIIPLNQYKADLDRAVSPMKGATLMEMVKQMKEASPTGALGMRITQLEAMLVSGIPGSVETDQSPDQLRESTVRHAAMYEEAGNIAKGMKYDAKLKKDGVPGPVREKAVDEYVSKLPVKFSNAYKRTRSEWSGIDQYGRQQGSSPRPMSIPDLSGMSDDDLLGGL